MSTTLYNFNKKQSFSKPTFSDHIEDPFYFNGFIFKVDNSHWLIDSYGVFKGTDLLCIVYFLRHDVKFDNQEVLSILNIEWVTKTKGEGVLSSLLFFVLSHLHQKIHLNENNIHLHGYIFKTLFSETSMIAKGYNNKGTFVSDDAMTILSHPAKLDVVVETLHNHEPHGHIEGFQYPPMFKNDSKFD
jgi:hypothetical protein